MVQRKVANRLGIQADHVHKGNLKLGFSQHQDGRNRAADMKKKMRKSRSIRLQVIESLGSSPLQPGKPPPPPPLGAQPAAAKQSVLRPSDGSPNYMKSTTSSDARKDQTGSGSRRRLSGGSKASSASVHKAARTSSLKMGKTLTKTPSFKPARASTKKCSNVALCADMDAHKATCSSTLKDSKFPEYLMLNPGGTEYEGTSVIKVCPYTYCSLNGHHHAPLPPLKCFLSARRRALKVQKTVKLEALSPRRAKLPGGGVKAIDGTLAAGEVDSGSPPVDMDFFIEIYAKSCDDTAEAIGSNEPNHETAEDDGQVTDCESDESAVSEIDFGDNMDQNSDNIIFAEASSDGDQKAEADEEYPPSWAAGEITPGYSSDGWESKSETTDMDWEEGQYLMEIKHPDLHDESTSYPDDNISKCFQEIISEAQQTVIDDENACFEVEFSNSDSDSDSLEQYLEDDESNQMSESPKDGQISSIFEEVQTHEEDDEKAEINNFLSVHVDSSPDEEEEPVAANNDKFRVSEAGSSVLKMYLQLGDDEAAGDIKSVDNPMIDQRESGSLQEDDAYVQLKDQGSDSSEDLDGADQYETNGDFNRGDKNSEDPQSDAITEGTRTSEEAFSETLLLKTEHLETNQNAAAGDLVLEQEPINGSDGGEEEKEQVDSNADNGKSSQAFSDESLRAETLDHSCDNDVEDPINSEKNQSQAGKFKISSLMVLKEHGDSKMKKSALAENVDGEADNMEVEDITIKEADISLGSNNLSSSDVRTVFSPAQSNTEQELVTTCNKLRGAIGSRRPVMESEEPRNFNPREPNYLPLEPDPEAEKVDLRHQMMDERKNSEEWMIDFALRKAVTELAPARKRKVALLVEAFETVLPLPKFEPRIRHTSAAFAHSRPIQACN